MPILFLFKLYWFKKNGFDVYFNETCDFEHSMWKV